MHLMKLWKKFHLNIFDILIVLLVCCVIGTLLWQRVSKKTEWITIRLVIANDEWWWEGQPPQWWYVDELQRGLTTKNTFGETVAEITNIDVFDIGGYRKRAYVDLKLKGSYDKKRSVYLYNFQPLQIGKPLDLTFGKQNVKGLVIYINKGSPKYTNKRIEVKVSKAEPYEAMSLVQGMKMKDSVGRTLVSIDAVSVVPYIEYVFSDIRGTFVPASNPAYRNVILQLTIQTFTSANIEYFMDRAVIKIGEKIWLQFPQTAIRDAEIIRIIE